MHLTHRTLKKYSLVYLALPALTFLLGFLRWYIALPAAACLLFGMLRAMKDNSQPDMTREITLGRMQLILLAGVILLWTWLGGLNGLFYQSDDWPWRNAIYHDLVKYRWPVVYPEKGSALVYYVGFWLPPALPAKLAALLTGSQDFAWRVAQGALWLWASAGLMLIALNLMFLTGADTRARQWGVVAVFIFFSGMDVIGAAHAGTLQRVLDPEVLHLEWWTHDGKQYSSVTTCLYWVFNQAIVPWLATACFLSEKDARNYVFLGSACLFCGPLPFVGLVILMIARWLIQVLGGLRAGRAAGCVKSAFSLPNLLILALILPVLGVYFLSNISVGNTAPQAGGLSLPGALKAYVNTGLIAFLALDAGFLCALIWPRHFKKPMFYAVAASLVVIPYFHIGTSEDFCLRASIPALFTLMVWCAEYLNDGLPRFRECRAFEKLLLCGLVLALLIGACTPLMEMYRGVYHAWNQGTILLAQDWIGSIANLEQANNFTAANFSEMFFFRYLAR